MRLAPWVGWLLCLGSGTAAILAHFSWVLVFLGAASGLILSWLGRAFLAARRRRADFFSGQSERVTRAADEEVDLGQVPSNYRILALVGVGDFAGARRALLASSDSSCHDTREIRLCARILIEAFEGEARQALSLCRDLLQGAGSPDARTLARRESVISIARILAGLGDEEDWEGLERTPTFEPALL